MSKMRTLMTANVVLMVRSELRRIVGAAGGSADVEAIVVSHP